MKRHSPTRRQFLRSTGGLIAASTAIGMQSAFGQAPGVIGRASKVTVRLEWSVTGHHAPWFVGLEKGTFAKAGLDVSVNPGRGSGLTAQAVAAGRETFGFVDASILPQAVSRGAEIRAVYGYIQQNFLGVMFFRNTGIKSPKDLEGKRYGDVPGTTTNALFPIFMKLQGADPSKVRVIGVDGQSKRRSFVDRQFEATACSVVDEFIIVRELGHAVDAFSYSEMGLNLLASSIVAGSEVLQKSPNVVRSLVAGWTEAVKITAQDPEAAAQITKRWVPDAPDAKILAIMIPEVLKRLTTNSSKGKQAGFMADSDWQATVDVLRQSGLLQSNVDIRSLYTNDFLPL